MTILPCPVCRGARLRPESLAVTVAGKSIADVTRMSIGETKQFVDGLPAHFSKRQQIIARQIIRELAARLQFTIDVGLEYLTLDRNAGTLSALHPR